MVFPTLDQLVVGRESTGRATPPPHPPPPDEESVGNDLLATLRKIAGGR